VSTTKLTDKLVDLPEFMAQTSAATTNAILKTATDFQQQNMERILNDLFYKLNPLVSNLSKNATAGAMQGVYSQFPGGADIILGAGNFVVKTVPDLIDKLYRAGVSYFSTGSDMILIPNSPENQVKINDLPPEVKAEIQAGTQSQVQAATQSQIHTSSSSSSSSS